MDLLKDEKLVTWDEVNFGYNVALVNREFINNSGDLIQSRSASAGGVVIGLSVNARYKFSDSRKSAAASDSVLVF